MTQTATEKNPDLHVNANVNAKANANVTVDVQREWDARGIPDDADIRSWVEYTLGAVRPGDTGEYEAAIRIVDEPEGRELNRRFRQADSPTNVLAFPSAGRPAGLPPERAAPLGDLVICGPVVQREAEEQGKSAARHWSHLLVHGVLHLLGYDHQTDAAAREMEALETELLGQRGIEDPYRGGES